MLSLPHGAIFDLGVIHNSNRFTVASNDLPGASAPSEMRPGAPGRPPHDSLGTPASQPASQPANSRLPANSQPGAAVLARRCIHLRSRVVGQIQIPRPVSQIPLLALRYRPPASCACSDRLSAYAAPWVNVICAAAHHRRRRPIPWNVESHQVMWMASDQDPGPAVTQALTRPLPPSHLALVSNSVTWPTHRTARPVRTSVGASILDHSNVRVKLWKRLEHTPALRPESGQWSLIAKVRDTPLQTCVTGPGGVPHLWHSTSVVLLTHPAQPLLRAPATCASARK